MTWLGWATAQLVFFFMFIYGYSLAEFSKERKAIILLWLIINAPIYVKFIILMYENLLWS